MDNKKEQQLDELCKLRAEDILRQMKSKADHDIRKIMAGQGSTSKLEYVGTIAKDLETVRLELLRELRQSTSCRGMDWACLRDG